MATNAHNGAASGAPTGFTVAPRVLLVEDEAAIADAVLYALRSEGIHVEHLSLGGEALARIERGGLDLAILDVGLPDLSGFELCRRMRRFTQLPVIFLTARGAEVDRVVGLEIGADDYVVKPFSPRELAARVQAILRRTRRVADAESVGVAGGAAGGVAEEMGHETRRGAASRALVRASESPFELDAEGQRIRYRGKLLELTRFEFKLLAALLLRKGRIASRAALMEEVWSDAPETLDRTVDAHIKSLRAKLREAGAPGVGHEPIKTHRGLGYSLEP